MTPHDRELADKLRTAFETSVVSSAWDSLNKPWQEHFLRATQTARTLITAELAAKAVLDLDNETYLEPFGYAPGNYSISCGGCGKMKNDCDKRAIRCKACAQGILKNTIGFCEPILATLTAQAEALRAEAKQLREALAKLADAADELEGGKSHTYKARNGRMMSIQGDDGERVDLVHSDLTHTLRVAAYKARAALETGDVKESE